MNDTELREKLADLQHAIWSHWMRYMFTQGEIVNDLDDCDFVEAWLMPHEKLLRWRRQMNTPYTELTEKEKESDRQQADKIISLLEQLK